jgi:hypothetical protein
MKAIQYQAYGSYEENRLVEVDRPKPKDSEVLVKMSTVGINPLDNTFRSGHIYLATPPMCPAWAVRRGQAWSSNRAIQPTKPAGVPQSLEQEVAPKGIKQAHQHQNDLQSALTLHTVLHFGRTNLSWLLDRTHGRSESPTA